MFGFARPERLPAMAFATLRRWIRRITGSPPHALASPDKLPRHEIAPEEAPQRPDDEEG